MKAEELKVCNTRSWIRKVGMIAKKDTFGIISNI